MRFIGFGKIHLSTFYPIFATISCITREYSLVMLTDNTDNYPVLFLEFLIFPSEMLSGFLYLLSKKSLSPEEKKVSSHTRPIIHSYKQLTFITTKKQNPIKIYLVLLGITTFDIVAYFLITYFNKINQDSSNFFDSEMRVTEFLFVIILGYFFLNFKLHRHHYLSLILIFIGLVLISIHYIKDSFHLSILLLILSNLLYSLMEIIEKWLMDIQYVSVYKLIFVEGLCGTIIMMIILFISIWVPCSEWMNNAKICNANEKIITLSSIGKLFSSGYIYYIQMLIFIVSTLGYNVFLDLINKTNGPTHRVVSDTLTSIIGFIISVILKNKNTYNLYYTVIGDILIICGSLVFNEIIIIYVFKLGESTRQEIIRRERGEIKNTEDNLDMGIMEDNIIQKEESEEY